MHGAANLLNLGTGGMDDIDMEQLLKKNNVIKIVRAQTSAQQEAQATQSLANTLEDISGTLRKDMQALIQAYRECREERTCLSIRLLFLDGKLNTMKKQMEQLYGLYRSSQMDYIAVKREGERRKKIKDPV